MEEECGVRTVGVACIMQKPTTPRQGLQGKWSHEWMKDDTDLPTKMQPQMLDSQLVLITTLRAKSH